MWGLGQMLRRWPRGDWGRCYGAAGQAGQVLAPRGAGRGQGQTLCARELAY